LFFSRCDSIAALSALANCNEHVAKTNMTAPVHPHPARFARRPQHGRLEWQSHLIFSPGIHVRAPLYFLFPLPNFHTEFITLLRNAGNNWAKGHYTRARFEFG
jgi:hypothetical protein